MSASSPLRASTYHRYYDKYYPHHIELLEDLIRGVSLALPGNNEMSFFFVLQMDDSQPTQNIHDSLFTLLLFQDALRMLTCVHKHVSSVFF